MTPTEIVARYRRRGLLVDANLLLLFFVGVANPEEIPRFKRTNHYTLEDFELLGEFVARFERVVVTPHILTEVSNLAGQLPDHAKPGVFSALTIGLEHLDERHTVALELSKHESFSRFGITDSAVLAHARDELLVLTDDFRLSGYLQSLGVDVFNFNHLRSYLL
jgi:hypothetical protein